MTVLRGPEAPATIQVVEAAEIAQRSAQAPAGRRRLVPLSTGACFGIALLCYMVALALDGVDAPWPVVRAALTIAGLQLAFTTLLALARALTGLVTIVVAIGNRAELHFLWELARLAGNLAMAAFGMMVAYLSTVGFARGRQLRRRGRVLLPPLRANAEWTARELALDAREAPAGLADQWRENGRTEHASVAAFARLTLDLMALGAPPSLIAAANQDSLDEIRHAELCFSLATALDGRQTSPAPFPEAQRAATLPRTRPLALARLAVSSLVDGALHEGVSARIIAQLARRSDVPAIRDVLRSIAADEGRHSAHGWAVVEWCLEQGGRGVGEALLGALRALPPQVRTALPAPAAEGGWERWGIHGLALEATEYAEAIAHVNERVRALVGAASARAA